MKKTMYLVLTLMIGVIATFAITPTYASGTDLYDDSVENINGGETITLLENSEYQLTVYRDDVVWENNHFMQELDRDNLSIDIYGPSNLTAYNFEGDSGGFNSFSTYTTTFTTGSTAENLYIDVSTSNTSALALMYPNVDIQVIWLGNTEPVDNVAPEYTYSNVEIDTPYYDLVTAAEVQAQLSAVDPEEGDVTNRIQVYDDQYTSITPKVVDDEYFIMFMVDDTAGNSAYLRVDINVVDDKIPFYVVTNLSGQTGEEQDGASISLTWYDDNYNNELDTYINQLAVEDEYYGYVDFESSTATSAGWTFNRTGDWGTYDPQTPGIYILNAVTIDPSGNSTTITFNVTVEDNAAPVINGASTIDYEAIGFDISDVLSDYNATDTEDGTAPVTVKSHNVTSNVLGTYSVVLSAIDSFGRETTKTITLNLVDTTLPQIKIDGIDTTNYSHTVNMSDTSTLQTLIDSITVTDNYDGTITSNLVVPAFPSFAVPGTHNLILTADDSSGNTATLNLEVIVADDIAPVINGATKIVKGLNETLTLSQILDQLTVTDNVDSNLSLDLVSDTFTGNNTNVGSYLVKYKATDTAGNITYHNVRVWVVDNQAPAWIINDYFVNLGINESMTRTELVSLLQAAGMIGSDISYTVTFLADEYTGNEEIEGAYQVVMNITYENGSEEQIAIQMNVPEPLSEDVIEVTPEEDLTGLQKAWNWIKTAFRDAWNWIKSAWDFIYNGIIYPIYEFVFVKDTDIVPNDDEDTTEEQTTVTQTTETPTTTEDPVQNLPGDPTTGLPVNEI